jgi:hypothetical protein
MGEHHLNRERVERVNRMPEVPVHPLGWSCEKCFHVVKDPNSTQMKCCRFPPISTPVMDGRGGMQFVTSSPPVQVGIWCGEFKSGGGTMIKADGTLPD